MKKSTGWLWGLALIALGVILGVNALGIVRIDIFFPGWWTLFIIVPSLVGLFTDKHKGAPMVGLLIGVCLLLGVWDVISFRTLWKLLVPALLVVIGVTMIARNATNRTVAEKTARAKKRDQHEQIKEAEVLVEEDSDDDFDGEEDAEDGAQKDNREKNKYWSTFGDQQVNYDGKTFTGCEVEAVLGGADIDLRNAKIEDGAVLKVNSVFGGIIVYAPEDVKVEVISKSVLGGVSDKRKNKSGSFDKTLYIEATCVFGGVEIR